MTRVGILYESDEWSDWKLHNELEAALGEPVAMINMEDDGALEAARACDVLVSRVFASAVFRGHKRAAAAMLSLVDELDGAVEMPTLINPPRAHRFEISKAAAARALEHAGLTVPRIQALGTPDELASQASTWDYPCIIKPDCGGRTTHTAMLHTPEEADRFLADAPALTFIVEDYVRARSTFMTRIELVDSSIALMVKRSIAPNGLSSYHEGSTYERYPDCPVPVREAVLAAGRALDIQFGSFDIIEGADGGIYLIDANSVSNVSEDCTDLFQLDLMGKYARALSRRVRQNR